MNKKAKSILLFSIITLFLIAGISFFYMVFVLAQPESVSPSSPPADSYTNLDNNSLQFNFTVVGANETYDVELFINGTGYGTGNVANSTLSTLYANTSLTDGWYEWYINATNTTTVQSAVWNFTLDTTPVIINSLYLNESDFFVSASPPNNIITLIANVTEYNLFYITANFSALQQEGIALINMSSLGEGLYNATITVTNVTAFNFVPLNITVFAQDGAGNGFAGQNVTMVVLYNMSRPPENPPCMRWGASTTNFSILTNFNDVNFVQEVQINLTCLGVVPPGPAPNWTRVHSTVALINFSSVNMSDPGIGQKLQGIQDEMNITLTPPRGFGDSRIYFNTTYFTELNTTTTITLYRLPFCSEPDIVADADAAGVNATTIVWQQGVGELNECEGNLTFTVFGFSGYNILDMLAPLITINTPADGANLTDSTPLINVTLNGTGTEISAVNISLIGATNVSYNMSQANCNASAPGSEVFNCVFNSSALNDGNYVLNVTAWDYGGEAGNVNSTNITFSLDASAPQISFVDPTPSNGSFIRQNQTINVSVTDANLDTVRIFLNNTLVANCSSSPCSFIWQTANGSYPDGAAYVNASANDSYGNINWTEKRLITVDNTAPTNLSFSLDNTAVYIRDSITGTCTGQDAIAGNLNGIISHEGTSSTGTFTATCTVTDSAGNSNSTTTSYTVSSWPSGGGPVTLPPKRKTQTWGLIEKGVATIMKIDDKDIGLKQITIILKNDANDVSITVTKLTEKPAEVVHEIAGKVYKYIKITHTNLADVLEEAKVRAIVEKSWLTREGIAKEKISIYRYETERWQELPTTIVEETADFVYYEAITAKLSYFAVGEKTVVEAPEEEVPEEEEEVPEEEEIPEELLVKAWIWILIGVIVIIIAIVLIAAATRKKTVRKKKTRKKTVRKKK